MNDPAQCEQIQKDASTESRAPPEPDVLLAALCGYDNRSDASTAFSSWYASGPRIADIQDPASPTKIAYYNLPSNPNTKF